MGNESEGKVYLYNMETNLWDWYSTEELADKQLLLRFTIARLERLLRREQQKESAALSNWSEEQELTEAIAQYSSAIGFAELRLEILRGI